MPLYCSVDCRVRGKYSRCMEVKWKDSFLEAIDLHRGLSTRAPTLTTINSEGPSQSPTV